MRTPAWLRTTRHATPPPRAIPPIGATALCVLLAGCGTFQGPAASAPATPSASTMAGADPFSLRVGDCIDDELTDGEVMQVPVVDCEEEHTAEAYHAESLPDGEYPGLESVKESSVEACLDRFETFAGIGYDDSQELDFAWYYPTEGSWAEGDREVLCLMMRIDPATGETVTTTGTLRDFGK